ncbi:MAG: hypothetical protein ACOH18_00350 [Candidatus Saccharimonadaceae bacterium]
MQTRRLWSFVGLTLVAALFAGVAWASGQAFAQSASSNYQMVETQFGNASSNETCSSQYCASVSIGNDSKTSPISTPEFGEVNYSEPSLEMIVVPGESNLGELTTEHTGSKVMLVKIRNYMTGGYRLQILGDAPKYGDRTLTTLTVPTDSSPGTEQFGINVVANTTPAIGANPTVQPGGDDATGLVMANYKIQNKFMYMSGDTLAQTQTNSGGADYTITMIVNVSNQTPAGKYSSDFAAVLIPYF